MTMINALLHDDWSLYLAHPADDTPAHIRDAVDRDRGIPATVPGCVYTDLLAADLIDDPYVGTNENDVQWIGRSDWRYACSFDGEELTIEDTLFGHDHIDLVCEGLDTVATVELNGTTLGTTENMHHPHRFDVRSALTSGTNHLAVTFASAVEYAEARRDERGMLPHVNPHPYNFIRKMACNFGWDWGPILVTAGIWKPISIQAWNRARINAVRPLVETATEDAARVVVHVDVEEANASASPVTASLRLRDPEGTVVAEAVADPNTADPNTADPNLADRSKDGASTGKRTVSAELRVADPERWWPVGHGDQPLYTLDVTLRRDGTTGPVLDRASTRVGLRTVALHTDPDDTGSAFTIAVNGKPIFCKGANWIPDDAFVTRIDRSQYRERLEQAVNANMNMLRVWGGGLYETDAFYDLCDEMGILVWQDFLFACAFYPEDDAFRSLVEREARYNVARLSSHPSLAVWNGNNECIWFDAKRDELDDDAWREVDVDRPWGLGYYLSLLPDVVNEVDPSRPYYPGSPYSGSMQIHPNEDSHGCTHVWEAWFGTDYTRHRAHVPRFASEFGHQAPPSIATLERAVPRDQWAPDAPVLLHHQKSPSGHVRLKDLLGRHFLTPDGEAADTAFSAENFTDWHFLTQLNQARALDTGIRWYRSRHPVCHGTLYWQLNDCWPVLSWSAIDGEGRPKLLWYATRRFYADRLLTIEPDAPPREAGGLALHAVNDADQPWGDEVTLSRIGFDGHVHERHETSFHVPPRRSTMVTAIPLEPDDPSTECLVAEAGAERTVWFFERDKNLRYPEPDFDTRLVRDEDEYHLTITARTLLRDLCLLPDHLDPDARASDQLITLLPGMSFTFDIASTADLSNDALTRPPVLQCANRFGA
jgi:beta-mannosidase